MPGLFTVRRKRQKTKPLSSVTIRDFSGGWNTMDNEEVLSTRFSCTLKNFFRGTDGGQYLRLGTFWFANVVSAVTGAIVDITYFRDRLIAFTATGQAATITGAGVVALLWNAAVAAALPGAPAGWSATTAVDFVPFKDQLVVHNGVDKPVTISSLYVITYLQDLATGSNVNTPIGKYGCTVANYHVIGGITATPTRLAISSAGLAGVFVGDPAPNDSITLDVGAYAPQDTEEIRGIAGFRNFLIVFFRGNTLTIQLGTYVGAVHTPQFSDTLPAFGLISHRCIVPIENDLLFSSAHGTASAKRNVFAGLIESQHLSAVIQNEYMEAVGALTDAQQKINCFAVQDKLHNQVQVHLQSGRVFVYSFNEALKVKSWSEFIGWSWTAGCMSAQGRVFYTTGAKIFQQANEVFTGEKRTRDFVNDRDADWAAATAYVIGDVIRDTVNGLVYICLVNHNSGAAATFAAYRAANPTHWTEYLGDDITFEWEMPWMDFRQPERIKKAKYIKFVTKGSSDFDVECFVDGLMRNESGAEIHNAQLSMEFHGDEDDDASTRKSNDPRLWGFPVKFKRMKLRFSGAAQSALKMFSITMLYSMGGYRRQ